MLRPMAATLHSAWRNGAGKGCTISSALIARWSNATRPHLASPPCASGIRIIRLSKRLDKGQPLGSLVAVTRALLDQPVRHVLAHECAHDDRRLVAVHNLSSSSCVVPLTLDGCDSSYHLVDLLHGDSELAIDDRGRVEVALEGYGYHWLRLMSRDSRRLA